MTRTVRWFLALEVVVFGLAALLHAGVLTTGYEHREARIAESVIGVVLLIGLLVTVAAPRLTRRATHRGRRRDSLHDAGASDRRARGHGATTDWRSVMAL
jgi:hypothetical protein